jgi:hypothetical protein
MAEYMNHHVIMLITGITLAILGYIISSMSLNCQVAQTSTTGATSTSNPVYNIYYMGNAVMVIGILISAWYVWKMYSKNR